MKPLFPNFRAYQNALELYLACEKIQARSHLRDQLLRASLSIVLNLSEGSARPSKKDRLRFYSIAFSSLRETQSILQILRESSAFEIADSLGGQLYRLVNQK